MCIAFLTMTKDAESLSIQPKPYQETIMLPEGQSKVAAGR